MSRVLADPPSRSGHILSKRELGAALRVLSTLQRPQPATVIMAWDNDMQDMLGGLQRARYVETRAAYGGQGPRKATASFRPEILATTPLGSEYLDSITKSSVIGHARKRRAPSSPLDAEPTRTGTRTPPQQLNREIAQSLVSRGQPQLADMFADPATAKTFAKEMRHEIQTKQAADKTTAALAARPFTVKVMEDGRRVLFGRYPNESEARRAADRNEGWIEHGGRVIYGRLPNDHAS